MNYIDGFREPLAAAGLKARIAELSLGLPPDGARIMEVCGTHTMSIGRYGLRSLLPPNVNLISGPGCPVCVTGAGYIDAAIELARRRVVVATFGDLLHVPGSQGTLSRIRADGAVIEVCYSPLQALDRAQKDPSRDVVFLAVGFETTMAPILATLEAAHQRGIRNLTFLTAFKAVIPALTVIASDARLRIDGFLLPPHVSAIIGSRAYEPFVADYHRPCVVAGFEPLDILHGIAGLLEQIRAGRSVVENQYSRVVKPDGNRIAQRLIEKYLDPVDADWRGLGRLPVSGLALKPAYRDWDAGVRFGIEVPVGRDHPACRCGDVIRGLIRPQECPLFDRVCNPSTPHGACMVSSEGSCAAAWKYERI